MLIDYEGPKRVEMVKFMLRGPSQALFDIYKGSRPAREMITWEDFEAHLLMEYQPDSLKER